MRLFNINLLFVSAVVSAQTDANLQSLLAQFSQVYGPLTYTVPDIPIPTRIGNIDPPPTSQWLAIFTGVPHSVIPQLLDPAGRSSIASEFDAGNTPQWYLNLPTPLQEYIEDIHAAIATGGYDYTPPPSIQAANTGAGSGDVANANADPSQDASGRTIQTPGRIEMAWLTGMLGILGLAVAL